MPSVLSEYWLNTLRVKSLSVVNKLSETGRHVCTVYNPCW